MVTSPPPAWNHLTAAIALQIRRAAGLTEILQSAVDQAQPAIAADRLLIHRFEPDGHGQVIAEAVAPPHASLLGQAAAATGLYPNAELNDDLSYHAIEDILAAPVSPAHRAWTRFDVRASLTLPIFEKDRLWGLLIAQQCSGPRTWQDEEIAGLQQVAIHLGIAAHQAALKATGRQRAAQVRRELNLLEQILEVVLAGYWDWDIPTHREYLSPGFKRMFGYEDHELANRPETWQQLIFPEDLTKAVAQMERHVASRGAEPYYSEVRYRHKNGSTIWVICSGQVIEWDEQGSPLRMIGCHIDITERKQAEAALQKSEQTNRALIHALPDFLVRMRRDGVQLEVINTGNIHCLGPKDEIAQPSVFEVMPEAIAAERVRLAQNALATGQVQRQEYAFTRSGTTYYEEARITPLPGDEVLVVVRDITQRVHAERVMRDSEATKRALINAIPDLMTRISEDGVYLDVLNQEASVLPPSRTSAAGCHIASVLPESLAQERMAYVQEALDSGIIQQYEYQIEVNGHTHDEEARLIPLDDTSVLAVIRDISEQKQREHRLQAAIQAADAANRAKSEFLANMSHEIRTPMNAVLGFTELLQRDVQDAVAQEYLAAIASSGQTLLHLINDILDLSKIEAGRLELCPEPVDIRALVQEVRAIFSQTIQEGVVLRTQVAEQVPPYLLLDDVRLRQILFNAVGNALKFTESGMVSVQVALDPPRSPQGDTGDTVDLQITVQDTGIGIAPPQQQQIFEAFTQAQGQSTRQYGGTGLGLAITRRLVHLMGGEITLKSALGEGSQFSFRFPDVTYLAAETLVHPESAARLDLERFAPARVLAVDDVASNRALLAGYFRGSAHTLTFATNGRAALQQVAQQRPDVILMDLRMPDMDGLEATRRLKANPVTRHIPVVLVTASSQAGDEAKLRHLCQGFIRKPISLRQLVEALAPLLPAASSPPAPASTPTSNSQGPAAALPPESRQRLLLLLRQMMTTLWQPIQKTFAIGPIERFAEALNQLAEELPDPTVVRYAETLTQQLDAFDWSALPQTIAAFETLPQAVASEGN